MYLYNDRWTDLNCFTSINIDRFKHRTLHESVRLKYIRASDPVLWDLLNAFIKLDGRKLYCQVVIDVAYYVGTVNNLIIYNGNDYY